MDVREMRPRFIVRRSQVDQRYSVWDSETDTVAESEGRAHTDPDIQDAFDAADKLNAGFVQQQQQPQPKDDKKE
jgi:hypothetical protein